jgi:hypothetical protein
MLFIAVSELLAAVSASFVVDTDSIRAESPVRSFRDDTLLAVTPAIPAIYLAIAISSLAITPKPVESESFVPTVVTNDTKYSCERSLREPSGSE